MPEIPAQLKEAGFGRVSRPALLPALVGTGFKGAEGGLRAGALLGGSRRLPVLLGDTGDRAGTHAAATLAAELFGSWPSGSLSDYYTQISYGQFAVSGDVHGWYRLPNNASYFEGSYGCNGLCSYPRSAGGFVRELAELADDAGVDWGQYDNDGPDGVPNSGDDDGYVDTVFIVHSGKGGECGGGNYIWSHSFYLRGWGIPAFTTSTSRAGGGNIKIDDYIIQPEISCWNGLIEIGVFCHEYGHALGLPDLYDTSGAGEGIGKWGLMASGSWGGDGASPAQPVHMCAWSKIFLGWIAPTVVPCDDQYELAAVQLAPSVLKVWSLANPQDEYFLIENRQQILNDGLLPGAGLNIWHIDENVISAGWYSNEVNAGSIYGVAMEQADGMDQLGGGGNRGDAGDPWPGSSGRITLTNGTSPDSRSNDGSSTIVSVTSISTAAMNMSADIMVGVEAVDSTPPTVTVLSPNGGEDWPVGTARTIGWQSDDNVGVADVSILASYDGGNDFNDMLAGGLPEDGSWTWQIPLSPSSSVVIKVVAADAAGNLSDDDSDALFTISDQFPPGIELYAPAGGEIWPTHSTQTVSWAAADNVAVSGIDILLSTDDGLSWPLIVASDLPNSGSYDWAIPSEISALCRLLVRAWDAGGLSRDAESGTFTLANLTAVPGGPMALHVGPCVPNPFNPQTTVHYQNPRAGLISIAVFNLLGRRVRTLLDEQRPAGTGEVRWDGRDDHGQGVASGVYYVQALAGRERSLMKVTLVR